jgi:hypothetical protein
MGGRQGLDILLARRTRWTSTKSLVTIPTGGEGVESQSPNGYAWRVINRLHVLATGKEMLSKARGTATPREIRDPGLFTKERLFPLVVLASFVNRTLQYVLYFKSLA